MLTVTLEKGFWNGRREGKIYGVLKDTLWKAMVSCLWIENTFVEQAVLVQDTVCVWKRDYRWGFASDSPMQALKPMLTDGTVKWVCLHANGWPFVTLQNREKKKTKETELA